MNQLKQALQSAGYSTTKKPKKKRVFMQCECGAILNKSGECIRCKPQLAIRGIILRRSK